MSEFILKKNSTKNTDIIVWHYISEEPLPFEWIDLMKSRGDFDDIKQVIDSNKELGNQFVVYPYIIGRNSKNYNSFIYLGINADNYEPYCWTEIDFPLLPIELPTYTGPLKP